MKYIYFILIVFVLNSCCSNRKATIIIPTKGKLYPESVLTELEGKNESYVIKRLGKPITRTNKTEDGIILCYQTGIITPYPIVLLVRINSKDNVYKLEYDD